MRRLCGLILVLLAALGCGEEKPAAEKAAARPNFSDIEKGNGPEVKPGDHVKVFYTGWLQENHRQFASNVGKEPLAFQVGGREVPPGLSDGVVKMQVGGKRKLWVPSRQGYGRDGHPPDVPPNADLIYEVELVGIGK